MGAAGASGSPWPSAVGTAVVQIRGRRTAREPLLPASPRPGSPSGAPAGRCHPGSALGAAALVSRVKGADGPGPRLALSPALARTPGREAQPVGARGRLRPPRPPIRKASIRTECSFRHLVSVRIFRTNAMGPLSSVLGRVFSEVKRTRSHVDVLISRAESVAVLSLSGSDSRPGPCQSHRRTLAAASQGAEGPAAPRRSFSSGVAFPRAPTDFGGGWGASAKPLCAPKQGPLPPGACLTAPTTLRPLRLRVPAWRVGHQHPLQGCHRGGDTSAPWSVTIRAAVTWRESWAPAVRGHQGHRNGGQGDGGCSGGGGAGGPSDVSWTRRGEPWTPQANQTPQPLAETGCPCPQGVGAWGTARPLVPARSCA